MLTEKEKKDLKLRIGDSIATYEKKRRRSRIRYISGIAAALAVLVFSSYYWIYFQTTDSKIENYVNTNEIQIEKDGDVMLVLNNQEEVKISEKSSNIAYSNSGEEVRINNSKKLTQSSSNSYNTIIVPYGKRTKITLSEGTQVWINSGSRLTYPVTFEGDKREVHLIGEAVFDVTHNSEKPFHVVTDDYEVKVLGTVFNVSSYQDDKYTSTALESGKVEIKYNKDSFFKKSKITITPGTLAVFNNETKTISSKKVDVSKYLSWRDGKFIFKKEQLGNIVKKLSRYYNVSIEIANEELKTQTFSGHLDLKDQVEKVIEVIKQTSDLDYKKENNKIVIN